MKEVQHTKYDELVRLSTKGCKEATEEIFSIGKTYLEKGELDNAAATFKDAAISYRISSFRNAALLEASQDLCNSLNNNLDVFREWTVKFPKGHPSIPNIVDGIDQSIIETAIYADCRYPIEPEIIHAYEFLDSALNRSNESFARINGNRPVFIYNMLLSYFGLSKQPFDFEGASIDARIGIDLLALKVIQKVSNLI